MNDCTPILPGLSSVCGLDIHARFDGGQMSSNGGALLLREAGRGFKFGEMLAGCISTPACCYAENESQAHAFGQKFMSVLPSIISGVARRARAGSALGPDAGHCALLAHTCVRHGPRTDGGYP